MLAVTKSTPILSRLTHEERNVGLGIVALILSVFFPLFGLPMSIIVARRSRAAFESNWFAELGIRVGTVLLSVAAIFVAVGFTFSVIVPLLSNIG